jgi:hypothetical protein
MEIVYGLGSLKVTETQFYERREFREIFRIVATFFVRLLYQIRRPKILVQYRNKEAV